MELALTGNKTEKRQRHLFSLKDVPHKGFVFFRAEADGVGRQHLIDVIKISRSSFFVASMRVFRHLLADGPDLLNGDHGWRVDIDRELVNLMLGLAIRV